MKPMRIEQFVMAYGVEQDRVRALLPEGFESLRPVLRINSEIRNETEVYLELNAPVEHAGCRGWLNIASWRSGTEHKRISRTGSCRGGNPMTIYDISQEVFRCQVYPGDPAPERELLCSTERGELYNLTGFRMCAHNGTHVDAPFHFLKDGKTVDEISLEAVVGKAYVAEHHGTVSGADARNILGKAKARDPEAAKRILIKGDAVVSAEAARVFAASRILLLGNESQSVGPEDEPMEVHLILLGAEVVLLEGIRLGAVAEGVYFLSAAPLNLAGADGSPCRAFLIACKQ